MFESGTSHRPDPAEADAFASERAKVLRRRVRIYCILMLGLMGLSAIGWLGEILETVGPERTPLRSALARMWSDGVLTTAFIGMLLYLRLRRPERQRVVKALTMLTIVAFVPAAVGEFNNVRYEPIDPNDPPTHAAIMAEECGMALLTFVLLHGLASLLVPMRLKESLAIVIPCWFLYGLVVYLLGTRPFLNGHIMFVAAFPIAAAPGVAWSAWRYRAFDERFAHRTLQEKFGEVSAELSHARRIHEALFPPPIERGSIRVAYRYEPMREIGGDFLFVHPTSFPPSEADGPLSVVLIDVSGHGVPAALAVNRLHGELLRVFSATPAIEPGALLAGLNAYAMSSLAPSGVFATALCLRVGGNGVVEWASGGHPTAYLRRADGSVAPLASTSPMLGVLPQDAFDSGPCRERLDPGDRIVAYTDGAIESRDADGQEFGEQRLRTLIISGAPDDGLALRLMDEVRAFRRDRVTDDTLIVEVWRA